MVHLLGQLCHQNEIKTKKKKQTLVHKKRKGEYIPGAQMTVPLFGPLSSAMWPVCSLWFSMVFDGVVAMVPASSLLYVYCK